MGGPNPTPGSASVSRPPLGIGLQPLISSVKSAGLTGVAEPWEVWWSRNREQFLAFRSNIEWSKSAATGVGSKSVSVYPIYDELLKVLAEGFADEDHNIASCSAIALGKARDAQNPGASNPTAVELLKKSDIKETRYCCVKNNALLGLGLTGQADGSDIIKKTLLDKKAPALLRSYAALALGYISNDPEIPKLLRGIITENDDAEVKSCACLSLGNLKDASAVPLLGKILRGASTDGKKEAPCLKAFAALGLGHIGTSQALNELEKVTPNEEKEVDVRSAVVIALGTTGLAGAKKPLTAFLQDKNKVTCGLAAISLAQIKDEKSYELISDGLVKNKSNDATGFMLVALGLTGNDKARADLRKVLVNERSQPLAKAAAAIGLGLLKDTESVQPMVNLLSDNKSQGNVVLNPYLILALGMIRDQRGIDVLQQIWEKADKNIDNIAYTNLAIALTMSGKKDDVIAQLMKHAEAKNDVLRASALHTIGLVGDRDSAQALMEGAKAKDNIFVRFAALSGIGFMLDKNPLNSVSRITADSIDIQMEVMDRVLLIPVW
ncbi:MAG: HEAT repeat domain-containing protein [Planctomycetota bacterium]